MSAQITRLASPTNSTLPFWPTGFPGGASGKERACQGSRHKSWVRSPYQEDPLEEEMAAHSSILVWRIPWTEEPGRLSSMRSQRVRHDWSDWPHTAGLWRRTNICLFLLLLPLLWEIIKKKKKMLRFMSKSILPKTPLEFYSILFSFRSLIHFEFIFVYGVTECSRFCHLQKHGTWRALG